MRRVLSTTLFICLLWFLERQRIPHTLLHLHQHQHQQLKVCTVFGKHVE